MEEITPELETTAAPSINPVRLTPAVTPERLSMSVQRLATWRHDGSEQRTGPRMNKKDNRNATEPIYSFIGNDETGAAMCRYYCPRCGLEFIRRNPCASHLAKCGVPKPERFKLELVQVLCGAKDDSKCIERIVAYEEQGIHAVCVSEPDGSWTIWKTTLRKAAKP